MPPPSELHAPPPQTLSPAASIDALGSAMREAAVRGVEAVLQVFSDWAGARAVGRGAGPPGALALGDNLWADQPERDVPELRAARWVVVLALDAAEAEARTRALLEASFEGLCLHEAGRLIEVNQALLDLYGYSREQMVGMEVSELAAPEILPRIRGIVASGYTGAYETLALTASGERLPLEARGKDTVWNGRSVRVAAFRDLRERKRVEAELIAARTAAEAASVTKSRFLANMSHELRTPMNGVLGMAELLLEDPLPDAQRERVQIIRTSGTHLMGLLNDILDLSKVEEGHLTLKPESVPLKPLLLDCLNTVRALAGERGLALRCDLPPGLPHRWWVDPLRLRQVLVNLLGNAVRHTWTGGVTISLRLRDDRLHFAVTDTGEGMSEEVRSGLFQRFSATTGLTRGRSGLGLSISRELVQRMGGEISVLSAPGQGTTMAFALPRAGTTPQARPPARLFVVDAEADRREALVAALLARDCTVIAHPGGPGLDALAASFDAELVVVRSGTWLPATGRVVVTTEGSRVDTGARVKRRSEPLLADELLELAQPDAHALEACPAPAWRTLDVLVVDDNPVNRMVAEQMVRRAGHRVTVVENGADALVACAERPPDLVLMDIEMPGMSGCEATRALRNAGYSGRVVALTAHALLDDNKTCCDAGMDDVLTKPVALAQLLGVLRDAASQTSEDPTGR